MTNKEKNKKRFDELGLGDLSDFEIARRIAVRKNGDVVLCEYEPRHDCIFKCGNCIKETEEWLTDEAEPEKPAPEKKEEKIELSKRQLAYAITSVVASVMLADNLSDAFEIAHKGIREVLDELFSGNPKIESDNLKEVIFKEAYEKFHTCDKVYDALFAVICNAGLEHEYLSFVRKESSHG